MKLIYSENSSITLCNENQFDSRSDLKEESKTSSKKS